MFRKKFALKLGLAFCLAMGVILVSADVRITRNLKDQLISLLQDQLISQARQMSLHLTPGAFAGHDPAWQKIAQSVLEETGVRLTLIRRDGRVAVESEVGGESLDAIENHAGRPEVVQALKQGAGFDMRHSRTAGIDFLYAALPYPSLQNPAGVVRLAMPLKDVDRKISRFRGAVYATTGMALLLGLVLIAVVSRWSTRSLTEIADRIKSMDEGRTDLRVPVESEDEIGDLARNFNQMAARLQGALERAQGERDEIAAILNSMVEQVITVDAAGKIFMMNPAAEKLFGVSASEAAGRVFTEVIRQAAVNDLLRFALEKKQDRIESVRLFLPEEKFFEVRARPVVSDGKARGALLVLYDVTQIRKVEIIRRDFVANVSHELRTPLTSIQGFAETLLAGAISDNKHNREFVETIHEQAERLTHLVNELLDLNATESGRRVQSFASVDLGDLAREVRDLLEPLARKQKVSLRLDVPENLPPAWADREQIKQVLVNLMDNAVKYNRADGEVSVEAQALDGTVCVRVRDTGIGIAESELPRIFERFYRINKSRTGGIRGAGLGLSIVKHILETQNGTIRAESVFGQGSTFIVTLPQAESPAS